MLKKGHLLPPLTADLLIERQNDANIVSQLGESLGQRACHVCQATGFDKRGDLGGGKENIHKALL